MDPRDLITKNVTKTNVAKASLELTIRKAVEEHNKETEMKKGYLGYLNYALNPVKRYRAVREAGGSKAAGLAGAVLPYYAGYKTQELNREKMRTREATKTDNEGMGPGDVGAAQSSEGRKALAERFKGKDGGFDNSACMSAMAGKVTDPAAFCRSLEGMAIGRYEETTKD